MPYKQQNATEFLLNDPGCRLIMLICYWLKLCFLKARTRSKFSFYKAIIFSRIIFLAMHLLPWMSDMPEFIVISQSSYEEREASGNFTLKTSSRLWNKNPTPMITRPPSYPHDHHDLLKMIFLKSILLYHY